MKKITVLCLFLLSLYVHADMVITESVDLGGQNMTMTMKIKGDKIRMDVSPQVSTIIDSKTGDVLTMMHSMKSYMVISGDKAKAMIEQVNKFKSPPAASEAPVVKPTLVDTGKSEKVGNFNTEIYTLKGSATNMTLWVTKDIPNYAELQEQFKKLQNLTNLGPVASLTPDTGDVQGFPVKTQMESNGKTITSTITSVEEKTVEDAEMAPPAGYSKISIPDFGGSGPHPSQP